MAALVYTRLQDHPRETYFATSGALIVGRIDCISAEAASEQWGWGMSLDIGAQPFRRGGVAASRADAAACLSDAWEQWKVWAGLRDIDAIEG
ncbi:hypothetical protein [Methylobacterium oxalidis]|uniref:Uncharacterized protein n=1 Tax=Methylobacterium oxalidis TaxID=944322 RepID=A0A512J392_9HYPH|nr:hypothetical protein [Methylobacterium oxalidis]GEP04426.1 hypothetical protein MOX02_24640 [Methylobacterium oxalidis]GJE35229.1 hypothetical protein LDDCCGHA_5447 [Methylobacterium oxalidis]GLS62798.1 hypothetical protein GCM10007888_11790 [Methylobacterium oxalidis]